MMKYMLKWISVVLSMMFITYIVVYAGPAKAEITFNTACGAEATGKLGRLSRDCWTNEYRGSCFNRVVTRAKPRTYVNSDGYWSSCPARVKDGEKVIKDCPRMKLTRWFKYTPGFENTGWMSPVIGEIGAANLGAIKVVKAQQNRWCTRTFECKVLPDGTTGWQAVAAGCKRP